MGRGLLGSPIALPSAIPFPTPGRDRAPSERTAINNKNLAKRRDAEQNNKGNKANKANNAKKEEYVKWDL